MKKIYTIICASALTLFSINANATNLNVFVGINGNGQAANTFFPSVGSINSGETVTFSIAFGTHTATSTTIPVGATPFNSGNLSSGGTTSFTYTGIISGIYHYQCSIHGASMSGQFTVSGTVGIAEPNVTLLTSVYPSPFVNNLTVNYSGINKLEVFNIIGEQVKSIDLGGNEGTIEMNFEGSPAGIYFYRTYRDGIVVETKKIVKAK